MPRIASDPIKMLPMRHANGPSPNNSIAPAITSLASCGCSEFGSSPSGAFAYGCPAGGRSPAITRAALT